MRNLNLSGLVKKINKNEEKLETVTRVAKELTAGFIAGFITSHIANSYNIDMREPIVLSSLYGGFLYLGVRRYYDESYDLDKKSIIWGSFVIGVASSYMVNLINSISN